MQKHKVKQDLKKTCELLRAYDSEYSALCSLDNEARIINNENSAKHMFDFLAKRLLKEIGVSGYLQVLLDLNDVLKRNEEQAQSILELCKAYKELSVMHKEALGWAEEERIRRIRSEASIQVNCEGCPAKQLAPCEEDD